MGRKLIKISDFTAIVIEPFKNAYGDYIGIREFYKPRDNKDAEWLPGRQGLSIPADEETARKVRKNIKWAVENFDEEHKVLEATKGSKAKKSDTKPKSKKKKSEDDDE